MHASATHIIYKCFGSFLYCHSLHATAERLAGQQCFLQKLRTQYLQSPHCSTAGGTGGRSNLSCSHSSRSVMSMCSTSITPAKHIIGLSSIAWQRTHIAALSFATMRPVHKFGAHLWPRIGSTVLCRAS